MWVYLFLKVLFLYINSDYFYVNQKVQNEDYWVENDLILLLNELDFVCENLQKMLKIMKLKFERDIG